MVKVEALPFWMIIFGKDLVASVTEETRHLEFGIRSRCLCGVND
jgi:hypothetical protein